MNCDFKIILFLIMLLFSWKFFISWPFLLFNFFLLIFSTSIYLFSQNIIVILTWRFLFIRSHSIPLEILLDPWGTLLRSIVLFISFNVLLFSKEYIKQEKKKNYFTIIVLLFILSINLLIFIPNLITLLLGWDGLGLTSFILVIYYQNPKSLGAGIITALSNRIGDVLILIAIALIFNIRRWNIIFKFSPSDSLLLGFIIFAACTKSAQLPFRRWLPAAIAAPTPVSALVHSSTLVTAGIFLLFRFKRSLFLSPISIKILLILRSLTIIMAGSSALFESDIKKIIALSTLRQLGVMISSTALFLPFLTFFHLISHALFKALIFICAGYIIIINSHSQDLRSNSLSFFNTPLINRTILISNCSLIGVPFLSGFFSKDLIIESSFFIKSNIIIFLLFFVGTALTAPQPLKNI